MLKANTMSLKPHKSVLLGTSALVCLALSTPVMATDFVITGSNNSTNGTQTTDGATAANIAVDAIDGGNTVSLGIALTTQGSNNSFDTSGGTNIITVSETCSITTTGVETGSIFNEGASNTAIYFITVKTTGARSTTLFNNWGDGNSFTLNEGATIIGDILATAYATNSKPIFSLGASTSYAYSVSGKGEGTIGGRWIFSDQDGRSQAMTTNGKGCETTIGGAGNIPVTWLQAVGNGNVEAQDEL